MNKKPKTFWEKLGEIDYRWLYLLSIIFVIIPILHPLGMAVSVSPNTVGYYDAINNLKPGSVVAVSFGASAALLSDQEAMFIATWKMLFQRDLKVIVYGTYPDSTIVFNNEMLTVDPLGKYGKKYGVDYVYLGYMNMGEAGETSISKNIRGIYPTDDKGTPLDQIPLMQGINDQSKIDLVIFQYTSCTDIEFPIRQWVVPYNKPCIAMTLGTCGPMAAPYYPTQIQGFLAGASGGVQIEVYSGNPGAGATINDAMNLGILPFLFFFVLGNLSYLGKRFKWGQPKKEPVQTPKEAKN
jgi:hypothetical protein